MWWIIYRIRQNDDGGGSKMSKKNIIYHAVLTAAAAAGLYFGVATSVDKVSKSDLEQRVNSGELRGPPGEPGRQGQKGDTGAQGPAGTIDQKALNDSIDARLKQLYPTSTPSTTPKPTQTPTYTPTPSRATTIDDVKNAFVYGFTKELSSSMYSSNPEGFVAAFGLTSGAKSQITKWYNESNSDGEVKPLGDTHVSQQVDGVNGKTRFYLFKLNAPADERATADFTITAQAAKQFTLAYLTKNPSNLSGVYITVPGPSK